MSASDLGRTLTHEHMSMRFDVSYVPPREEEKDKTHLQWTLRNTSWIRQNP